MQLLLSLIQRCVVILIQNKIWCSLFECFCSTELFSWLFYNQHSHRPVVCLYHSVMEWSLPCNWNNKCLIKNNILTVIKLAPVTLNRIKTNMPQCCVHWSRWTTGAVGWGAISSRGRVLTVYREMAGGARYKIIVYRWQRLHASGEDYLRWFVFGSSFGSRILRSTSTLEGIATNYSANFSWKLHKKRKHYSRVRTYIDIGEKHTVTSVLPTGVGSVAVRRFKFTESLRKV